MREGNIRGDLLKKWVRLGLASAAECSSDPAGWSREGAKDADRSLRKRVLSTPSGTCYQKGVCLADQKNLAVGADGPRNL